MTLYLAYGWFLTPSGPKIILIGIYDSEKTAHSESQIFWMKAARSRIQITIKPVQLNETATIKDLYDKKYSTYTNWKED